MASKFVRIGRIVTYHPDLRVAVLRCRSFSSASNELDIPFYDAPESNTQTRTVWPDHILGPLGPQDRRFLMPGRVGPCVNTSRLQQEINAQARVDFTPSFNIDQILPQLPHQRQSDISEQFLTSIDEIDIAFIDKKMSPPVPSDKMEYRANSCPQILRKDFKDLFPDKNLMEGNLTVISISVKTNNDMTYWSSEVEREREELLDSFVQGAAEICQAFEEAGFWADFIDPSSGKPFKGAHTNFTLFETDERYRKLGFEILDLGCCKVISHPLWGTHSFIGTLFTSAPLEHPLIANLKSTP
ncbi:methylmalonic aciduria and homocystinuria type d homolog, mitochondrial [Plakobranchus ocellatus]|uniref:Methylmalonic aciduria and homocystinuria type d homolog, mitochondrial n=1 Tax=Plakobranchus ocellatus TaxID=259542 RepID=A0AAV3X5M9_9GAST|nr:methylmalonic aciduria and homocystinuria type d homolog, mitochondrial [Plakobranchus ocellatus]